MIYLIYLILIILFVGPIVGSGWRMIVRFRRRKGAAVQREGKGFSTTLDFVLMGSFSLFLLIGFLFNHSGIRGGMPLHGYADGTKIDGYATLAPSHLGILIVSLILGLNAYWMLRIYANRLPPLVYIACSALLLLNIGFAVFYVAHTGFSRYLDNLNTSGAVIFLQAGFLSLIFLYVGQLKQGLDDFLAARREQQIENSSRWMSFLYRCLNYRALPLLWLIFSFPVLIILQLILVLFGQRPDSAIRMFLDTSSFNYSQLPVPPVEVVAGDGHYLCTVAAKGHTRLVKPVRAGIRHGVIIPVNRQLMIANAFENILEQYTPRCHRVIRGLYNKYGYPVSKHIQTKGSADAVYLLMKPLEWLFLAVLYTTDRNPENRIHRQYSELSHRQQVQRD